MYTPPKKESESCEVEVKRTKQGVKAKIGKNCKKEQLEMLNENTNYEK